jgi:hypothetical protein
MRSFCNYDLAIKSVSNRASAVLVKLPFDDVTVDLVTAVCVYHHVHGPARALLLREIKRVLTPRGLCCILEHNLRNPVTRAIVRRCPVDVDAELLPASEVSSLLNSQVSRRSVQIISSISQRRFSIAVARSKGDYAKNLSASMGPRENRRDKNQGVSCLGAVLAVAGWIPAKLARSNYLRETGGLGVRVQTEAGKATSLPGHDSQGLLTTSDHHTRFWPSI